MVWIVRHANLIVIAWLAGVTVLALRGAVGWMRLFRRLVPEIDADLLETRLAQLARKMGMVRCPRLRVTTSAVTAMAYGFFRAVIVIPGTAILGLTPAMLDSILAHELAHVRRNDYIINLVQCLIETALFYHPAVWWVSNCIRHEREVCCDEVVISTLHDRLTYARALERLESLRSDRLAVAANGGELLPRIHRILGTGAIDMHKVGIGRSSGRLAAGIIALVLGVVIFSGERATSGQTDVTQSSRPAAVPITAAHHAGIQVKPIEGPGVIITLTDSMLKARAGHGVGDGLIHDSDLQRVVQALRGAAAKEIYICDQRVDRDTRIRAWGNNITVNSFGLGRPFVVRALGDPNTLRAAVEAENGVLDNLRHIDPAMVTVETSDLVKMPAPNADRPSAAYIVEIKIFRCEVSADGTVSETLVSKPAASTFAGVPASFSVSSGNGEGESVTINPSPATNHRVRLSVTFEKTELHQAPMRASTPAGYTVERRTNVRTLGVVLTEDDQLRKAVTNGKLLRGHGKYIAYYVEVRVE
jgi:uncharacterized protein YlxW (UPF0749 family)